MSEYVKASEYMKRYNEIDAMIEDLMNVLKSTHASDDHARAAMYGFLKTRLALTAGDLPDNQYENLRERIYEVTVTEAIKG